VLGEFTAVSGLSGSWVRPLQEYARVTAVGVPVSWSVDSAVPAASGLYPLTWLSRTPVSPLVRLTDSSSLALLQNWLVIFAVAFGVSGAMLASLLFEWLRRPHQDDVPASSRSQPPGNPVSATPEGHPRPTAPVPGLGHWLALAGTVIVIGYARRRLTQSRRD